MGENKALLKVGGKMVIERIADQLATISSEMIVVANNHKEYRFLGLPLVSDHWKEKGPLAGIHAGLMASKMQKNLIVACDMPFISAELGKILLKKLDTHQAAVPEIDGRLHPLFAAYRKDTKEAAEQALKDNRLRIRGFLHDINASIMKGEELKRMGFLYEQAHFFNMNRPDEYQMALKMAADKGKDPNKIFPKN